MRLNMLDWAFPSLLFLFFSFKNESSEILGHVSTLYSQGLRISRAAVQQFKSWVHPGDWQHTDCYCPWSPGFQERHVKFSSCLELSSEMGWRRLSGCNLEPFGVSLENWLERTSLKENMLQLSTPSLNWSNCNGDVRVYAWLCCPTVFLMVTIFSALRTLFKIIHISRELDENSWVLSV